MEFLAKWKRRWQYNIETKKGLRRNDNFKLINLFIEMVNEQEIHVEFLKYMNTYTFKNGCVKISIKKSHLDLEGLIGCYYLGYLEDVLIGNVILFKYDKESDKIVLKKGMENFKEQLNEKELDIFFANLKLMVMGENTKLRALLDGEMIK